MTNRIPGRCSRIRAHTVAVDSARPEEQSDVGGFERQQTAVGDDLGAAATARGRADPAGGGEPEVPARRARSACGEHVGDHTSSLGGGRGCAPANHPVTGAVQSRRRRDGLAHRQLADAAERGQRGGEFRRVRIESGSGPRADVTLDAGRDIEVQATSVKNTVRTSRTDCCGGGDRGGGGVSGMRAHEPVRRLSWASTAARSRAPSRHRPGTAMSPLRRHHGACKRRFPAEHDVDASAPPSARTTTSRPCWSSPKRTTSNAIRSTVCVARRSRSGRSVVDEQWVDRESVVLAARRHCSSRKASNCIRAYSDVSGRKMRRRWSWSDSRWETGSAALIPTPR